MERDLEAAQVFTGTQPDLDHRLLPFQPPRRVQGKGRPHPERPGADRADQDGGQEGDSEHRQLGTAPWLTILFVLFGLAAGVLNVYRTMSRVSGAGAPKS